MDERSKFAKPSLDGFAAYLTKNSLSVSKIEIVLVISLWIPEPLPELPHYDLLLPNQHADEISSQHIPTEFGSIYNDVLYTDVSSPKCSEGDPNEEGWDPGSPGTSGLNGNGNYDEDMEAIGPANVIPDIKRLKVKVEKSEPDDQFDPIVACIMNHKKMETTGRRTFLHFLTTWFNRFMRSNNESLKSTNSDFFFTKTSF